MALRVVNNQIFLTRGDTAYLDVAPMNDDGTPYDIQPGDKIYFRLKLKPKDDSPIICEKEVNTASCQLHIEPQDTEECINNKDYRYELELVTAAGDHYTYIQDELFHIGVELG